VHSSTLKFNIQNLFFMTKTISTNNYKTKMSIMIIMNILPVNFSLSTVGDKTADAKINLSHDLKKFFLSSTLSHFHFKLQVY